MDACVCKLDDEALYMFHMFSFVLLFYRDGQLKGLESRPCSVCIDSVKLWPAPL